MTDLSEIPQLGDLWSPKPDAKYASPTFLIIDVAQAAGDPYCKVLFLTPNVWCWYGIPSITKDYELLARTE